MAWVQVGRGVLGEVGLAGNQGGVGYGALGFYIGNNESLFLDGAIIGCRSTDCSSFSSSYQALIGSLSICILWGIPSSYVLFHIPGCSVHCYRI
jgi:hypothetical protein